MFVIVEFHGVDDVLCVLLLTCIDILLCFCIVTFLGVW